MWADSSFKYKWIPGVAGRVTLSRGVSAECLKSASIFWRACISQLRRHMALLLSRFTVLAGLTSDGCHDVEEESTLCSAGIRHRVLPASFDSAMRRGITESVDSH